MNAAVEQVMKLVVLTTESSTKMPVTTSFTATSYVAPLVPLQLNVTVTLPVVGPGLVLLPGLRFVGTGGEPAGVWK